MRTALLACIAFFVLAALSGCDAVWSSLNRGGLQQDISELYKRAGSENIAMRCSMVGSTRTGWCEGTATTVQALDLSAALKLESVPFDARAGDRMVQFAQREGGCTNRVPQDATFSLYKSQVRAETLKLSNGGAFEYVLLYHNPSTNQFCVQISYAYG